MKATVTQLAMAMGLLVLPALGTGCDSEPEGSCTKLEVGSYSGDDPSSYESHEVCYPNSTASTCAVQGGKFEEGDNCFVFNVLHPPT